MRRSTLLILAFLAVWMAGVFAVSWSAYGAMRHSGSVEVHVDDGYQAIHFALPAFLPSLVLDQVFWAKSVRPLGVHHEVEDWGAVLLATIRELDAYENVPLLTVDDGDDRVRIHKRGDRIVVDVTSRRESVRVVLPLRTVRRVLERYES